MLRQPKRERFKYIYIYTYDCPLVVLSLWVDSDNFDVGVGDYAILEIDEGKKDLLRVYRQMSNEKERKKKKEKENK